MKYPLKFKKEVIQFRLTNSWRDTCDKYPNISCDTFTNWVNRKDIILNLPEMSSKEITEYKEKKRKEYSNKYKKLHPDENPSVKRLKHPLTICAYYANGNFKKYKSKNKVEFTKLYPFDFWKIAKKQRVLCPITGLKLTSENISVDHIIPVSKGGSNMPSNIRLVHKMINHMKNHYSDKQFFEMCLLVSKHFVPVT